MIRAALEGWIVGLLMGAGATIVVLLQLGILP